MPRELPKTASDPQAVSPGRLRNMAASVGWLAMEKCVQLLSGVLVGFWVVRALGPQEYGHFSAAVAVTAVFGGLANMGLETTMLRRLTAAEHSPGALLRAAARLRLVGSAIYIALCVTVSFLLFPHQAEVAFVAMLIASSAVFRIPDLIGLWMQAEDRYAKATLIRIFVRIGSDAFRIALILQQASMYWFAVGFIVESMLTGGAFAMAGRRMWTGSGRFSGGLRAMLLEEGRPIVISGILAGCYARIDQLVLYMMLGADQNGQYAAAVRISEVFNLLILSIGAVAAPYFGRMRQASTLEFEAHLIRYSRFMVCGGLAVSATLCLFAEPLVRVLFGPAFGPATAILRVHAWTIALVFASVAMEPWFYHHGSVRLYVRKTLLALCVAIPAAPLATHFFGPVGTAGAVVAVYAFSVFATNAIIPGARPAWRFQRRMLFDQ